MEKKRKSAYRDLLYHSLVLLRSGPRKLSWSTPWKIPSQLQEMKRNKELADALHNMALFSVIDFDGFNEETFWKDLKRVTPYRNQSIEELLQKRFDWYLAGDE